MPLSTSSPVNHASSRQRLEDDVELEFDVTQCLSKLIGAWENLSVGAASFGEQLYVGIFFFLFWHSGFFYSLFLFSSFFCRRSLSLGITLAFLAQVRQKLSFELSQLKAQLASKEVELDFERQGR
jgi:hypothetical protein